MSNRIVEKKIAFLFGLTLPLGMLVCSPPANAETYQIAGVGFQLRCPCPEGFVDDTEEFRGVLQPRSLNLRFFAPIDLPSGQRVCRFSMVYHDITPNDAMVATLQRKPFGGNQDPFLPPTIMAAVQSAAGTPNIIRRVNDTTIASPIINDTAAFYFVQVDIPTTNLNLIGVQIEVKPTCP
jgi:hypothetical protein